jgi:hypothetical protein
VEQYTCFTNGEWIGRPFRLQPWQRRLIYELFEVNVKDFALRGEIIVCETDERGLPVVEVLNPIVESIQDADAGITNAEAAST